MKQHPDQRLSKLGVDHKRTGQALTEFALVLPLLLLIVFGIIEFARIFQAYLVIVNSARFAVRYAVTGEYDFSHCIDYDGDSTICDGDSRNIEENHARLLSIYDVIKQTSVAISRDDSSTIGQPGYFHYSVCSSNEPFQWDPAQDSCINGDTGTPADDPGDPIFGTTRVMVAITFEHPLILPIISSISPTVHLHTERTGILEQFRVTRILGLPPDITIPSQIPTATQTPTITNTPIPPTVTNTAMPSSTPTITMTPSLTLQDTQTPTPVPPTSTPTVTNTPLGPIETSTPTTVPISTNTSIPPTITPTRTLRPTWTPTATSPFSTSTPMATATTQPHTETPTTTPRPTNPGGG